MEIIGLKNNDVPQGSGTFVSRPQTLLVEMSQKEYQIICHLLIEMEKTHGKEKLFQTTTKSRK